MNNKSLLLDLQEERGFSAFIPVSFLTQYSLLSCSEGGPKPSAFHLLELAGLHLHRLSGVLWSLRGAHPHGALLPDLPLQPLAAGLPPGRMGPGWLCRGSCLAVYSFIQVSVLVFSPSTVRCSGTPALGIERQDEGYHVDQEPFRLGTMWTRNHVDGNHVDGNHVDGNHVDGNHVDQEPCRREPCRLGTM